MQNPRNNGATCNFMCGHENMSHLSSLEHKNTGCVLNLLQKS